MAKKWPEMVVKWAIVIVIRFYSDYIFPPNYAIFFFFSPVALFLSVTGGKKEENSVTGGKKSVTVGKIA